MQIDSSHIPLIQQLCRKYRVKSLSAFGSVLREDFSENSDIDLIVDFDEQDPFEYTDLYFQLKEKLENLFQRPVDLIEARAIKNRFIQKEIDNTKISIYK